MEICSWGEWGFRGHLYDKPEAWDGGGSQESIGGVALAEIHRSGDTEHEVTTS